MVKMLRFSSQSTAINLAFIYTVYYFLFVLTKPSFLINLKPYEICLCVLFSMFSFTLIFFFIKKTLQIILKIPSFSASWVYADQILIKSSILILIIFFIDGTLDTFFGLSFQKSENYLFMVRFLVFITFISMIFFLKKEIKITVISESISKIFLVLSIIFGAILAMITLLKINSNPISEMTNRPHIIFLSTDGLTRSETDLNNEIRNLTPNLKKLSSESISFERAFPSGANTPTSIFPIFTGRSPFFSGMIFPPDIFQNYLESPVSLLKDKWGYKTIIDSIRYYADPFDRNLRNTFNKSNGQVQPFLLYLTHPIFINTTYYLYMNLDYWKSRLNRLFGFQRSTFFLQGQEKFIQGVGFEADRKKIQRLLEELKEEPKRPKFIFTHLLGTHVSHYKNTSGNFSINEFNDSFKFFDNHNNAIRRIRAIRDFDDLLGELIKELKVNNIYNDSIIVITSDHSENHSARFPVPLVVKMPQSEKRKIVSTNFEIKDVLPLILNSLDSPFKFSYDKKFSDFPLDDSSDQVIYQINRLNTVQNFGKIFSNPSLVYLNGLMSGWSLNKRNEWGGLTEIGLINCDTQIFYDLYSKSFREFQLPPTEEVTCSEPIEIYALKQILIDFSRQI